MQNFPQLPLPPHYQPENVDKVWPVPYEKLAIEAEEWSQKYQITNANQDKKRIILKLVDCQNTFCLPDFELFVRGSSGRGAIDDSIRICEFIYRNLNAITQIIATMDTHIAIQIFHPIFWIDAEHHHPAPFTIIHAEEVRSGRWQVNPDITTQVTKKDYAYLKEYAQYYVDTLQTRGKYPLTIWPYHAMIGSISHALVAAIEAACFFHTIARNSQTHYELKGQLPLTEHYSVLAPEILTDQTGANIAARNLALIDELLAYDVIIIAGQAKSHCLTWSVENLLAEIKQKAPNLLSKVYLLEDCTSPVVVPGAIDYTEDANEHFRRFAEAGVNLVKSTQPMHLWPNMT